MVSLGIMLQLCLRLILAFYTIGKKNICGVDRNTGSSTKAGDTDFGQYPWTVMILRFDKDGRREFLCNGVLIDSRRVLTVGQCVADFE